MKPGTLTRPLRQWPAVMVWVVLSFLSAPAAVGQEQKEAGKETEDFTDLDLSTLMQMDVEVTSVSKKETKLSESPAAIAVLTQEDIRRMGITTLAEALRLIPGINLGRVSANEWAIGSRGFNAQFAHHLLVLMDGRTLYTPASAGVFWKSQDTMLEDVERIEVIRGPGATLWGANAVNGVINIITKRAQDTQGTLISGAAGTEDRPLVAARYGSRIGKDFSFRMYAKYFDREGLLDSTRTAETGAWHYSRGGFRTDWLPTGRDNLTVQGDAYSGEASRSVRVTSLTPPSVTLNDPAGENTGVNLLGRWTRTLSADSSFALEAYVDRVKEDYGYGAERRDTYDVDLQHRFGWGSRHDILWGSGYRLSSVEHVDSFTLSWAPHPDIHLFNLFVQDEITVVPNQLHLTLGSKFEHSNISKWSVQPNVRLGWTLAERQTLWAAISRATRTPALFELGARLNVAAFRTGPTGPPVLMSIMPDPQLDSEKLVAYELGYRFMPSAQVSVDIASFMNRYRDVIGILPGASRFESTPTPPHVLLPLLNENALTARTYGVEALVQWQVLPHWKLTGSYTGLRMRVRPERSMEEASPEQQLQLRSYLDLPFHLELNTAIYYVDATTLPSRPTATRVPSYLRGDLGLVWKPSPTFSAGIWGQNLFEARHMEFVSSNTSLLTPVPRSVVGRVTWTF